MLCVIGELVRGKEYKELPRIHLQHFRKLQPFTKVTSSFEDKALLPYGSCQTLFIIHVISPSLISMHLKDHLHANRRGHTEQSQLAKPEVRANQPALSIVLVLSRVSHRVRDPSQHPTNAENAACDWVPEAGNEEGGEERSLVLEVVAVGTLGAVEEVHGVLLVGIGGGHLS